MAGYFFRYVVPKIGKNLAKKRKHQDDIVKTRDKIIKEYGITDSKVKTDLRTRANQPKINKKIADIQDRARVKKMGGGMMGRRFGMKSGTNPFKKETDVDKIKKTFSPKGKNLKPVDPKKQKGLAKLPRKVRNNMGYMKSGGQV